MAVGAEWPVATELALPSLAERPGSFVVSFSAPIGGRCGQECGIQFGEFAVSFLLQCFALGLFLIHFVVLARSERAFHRPWDWRTGAGCLSCHEGCG